MIFYRNISNFITIDSFEIITKKYPWGYFFYFTVNSKQDVCGDICFLKTNYHIIDKNILITFKECFLVKQDGEVYTFHSAGFSMGDIPQKVLRQVKLNSLPL